MPPGEGCAMRSDDQKSTSVVMPGTCIVEVSAKGAICGISMPDGTPIPEVIGITVTADADDVQIATVSLHARVRPLE